VTAIDTRLVMKLISASLPSPSVQASVRNNASARRVATWRGATRRCFQPHTSHFQFKNNENLPRIGEAVAYRYPLTAPTSHSRAPSGMN